MPNEKITDQAEDTTPASNDWLVTVDVSDTSDSPQGTNKKVQIGNLGSASIADDSITNAKLANMATQTIKGRTTAGSGDPEDLTATQATAILNAMVGDSGSGGTKGLVPAPGAGDAAANKFLKADGTFAVPAGGVGGLGDVVGPSSATDNALARFDTTTGKLIQNSAVTIADDGSITIPEIAAPGTPAAGKIVLYGKSDNKIYRKGEDGVEAELGGGGGTNPTSGVIPYNNGGTLADSKLTHDSSDGGRTFSDGYFIITRRGLGFSVFNDFGGLIGNRGSVVVTNGDNSTPTPGSIYSAFATMPTPGGVPSPWTNSGMNYRQVLTGNTTIGNPALYGGNATAPDGYRFLIMLVQDGTGGRTVTWSSDYKFPGGSAPTMTAAANAVDIYEFIVYSDTAYLVSKQQDVR